MISWFPIAASGKSAVPATISPNDILYKQFYYGDLGYYFTSADDFSHTLIGTVGQNITLNSKIMLEQYTRVLFMNHPDSNDGALLAIAPGDKIITAFRNNGVWEEKSSHFLATKSDLANKTKTWSATISTKHSISLL